MSKRKLLIIGFTWPEPATTAAGNRMLQLIHFFLEEGYYITCSSTASTTDKSFDLESLGIDNVPVKLNDSSFDDFIQKLNPEVVLFDRFLTEEQFGWRVAEFAPNALRILDTEDLHSLRHTREKALKSREEFTANLWLQNDITKREISSIYRSDITLVISSYEIYLLNNLTRVEDSLLLHLPFMLNPFSDVDIKNLKTFEKRTDFICIGNGKHAPNVDAVVWLKKEIWPLIRQQLPKANLNIYGAYLPEHLQQMHNPSEGFLVHGWVEDLKSVMQNARINVAPLRFGAGLKGKLVDAMRYGTPSISTAIGAEGMHDDCDFNGRVADMAETFAKAGIELYENESAWKESQTNGFQIINENFESSAHKEKLRSRIKEVFINLHDHRRKNFTGQLLQHQTMQASKYMSKWIEEKNSKSI